MQFYISDTFTESLKRLSNSEQKIAKTTVFDYQTNPSLPSLQFHRIDKSKDSNFWSIRINQDLRIVVHKQEEQILICYVDHHDKAYQWAEKRRLDIHPKTGAVQLVVIPETLSESQSTPVSPKKKKLFLNISKEMILACGVPQDWISTILEADEDTLFDFLHLLPAEAGEALLDLASGKKPGSIPMEKETHNPFEHPDSLRRFKLITGQTELEEALLASWSKWAVYLHPLQKSIVEKEYRGPVRISGSAGTGKTIVALHRATFVARKNPEAKILLVTFSDILANSLHQNFIRLVSNSPDIAERVEVITLEKLAIRFYKRYFGNVECFTQDEYKQILSEEIAKKTSNLNSNLVSMEVLQVVDAWNLEIWEDYKDFIRLGRRSRLKESQRREIWNIFFEIRNKYSKSGKVTLSQMYYKLAQKLKAESHSIFDAVIIDEAQDLTPSQMEFVSSLSKVKSNYFFTGDLGQRIFQIPFSWKSFDMDIRGRSFTLKVNYRTSEQIRSHADKLLSKEISDFDGNLEKRKDTISLFQGPKPEVLLFQNQSEETKSNQIYLQDLLGNGFSAHEILIIVRSSEEYKRVESLQSDNINLAFIEKEKSSINQFTVCTMHSAKGLEYRAVIIMACDSNVIPNSNRLEQSGDESELEEIYATERQLLYVACTRARDHLRITGVKPGSEFLEDMLGG